MILSIGFDRDRGSRQRELTNNKIQKDNVMLELCSKMFLALLNTFEKLLMD